jgi:hypothetical protein
VKEIIEMLGLMLLTSYDMLSEHDLFKSNSEIKNIGIMSLLLLEFLESASDMGCGWGCEVVRLCDESGIELDKEVRKQVSVSKKSLKDMREVYMEKKQASDFGVDGDCDGNGYMAFANKANWEPEDDMGGDSEKMWYRWDWALEVSGVDCFEDILTDVRYAV